MSWRSGTAAIAVLSLAILPLSIGSASADDAAQPSPSASPASDSSTPPASAPQDSLPATTPSTPAPSEAAPTSDAGSSAPATKTIIVTFDKAQSDPAQAAEAAVAKVADQVADAKVTTVTPITNSMVAVTLDSPLTTAETTKVESQVSDSSGVKAAAMAGWFRPTATNDADYTSLWNLNSAGTYGVHAEDAWATTTGASTIVGVIDTGITGHPDVTGSRYRIIGGNVVDGYDFISSATIAGDGNGRDSNPTDTGDFTKADASSWHGTHVAGIIAAIANNGIGVAGVAPGAKVEPLRALGRGGGAEDDVITAILWGAGIQVTGLPLNSQPVDVLNLSLGESGTNCSAPMQTAIDAATARGVIVVAAAGNGDSLGNGLPVATSSPANCRNVISVGATTKLGNLASYSNYGNASQLTIAAPGGGDGSGLPGESSIFSTYNLGETKAGSPSYAYMSGTSMAAPHVAATVALLKSVDPSLGFAEVKNLLTSTASTVPSCDACGAGRLDAAAAVTALVASLGVEPASAPLQTAAPLVDGVAQVGQTLKAQATAAPTADLTYQWYRDSGKIAGATSPTYRLSATDNASHVLVKVTAASGSRKTIQFSAATGRIAAGVLANYSTPKTSGKFRVGTRVSVSKGKWSPSPSSYSYRWLRNGKSITGATKSKYRLTSKDRGKRISVRVTAKKSGYTTLSATSSKHLVKR